MIYFDTGGYWNIDGYWNPLGPRYRWIFLSANYLPNTPSSVKSLSLNLIQMNKYLALEIQKATQPYS